MSKIKTNSLKIQMLESAFGESTLANAGTNIAVVCPVCKANSKKSSSKKKLSIDLDKGMYHCWVCESKGKNIGYFVRKNTNASKKLISEIYDVFEFNINLENEKEEIVLKLPGDFQLLYNNKSKQAKIAIDYLQKRGLSTDDFLSYKIGISNEYEYTNRVIFSSFCNDLNLNFFLSRTYDNTQKIKYRNCDGKKKDIIYNEYMIDWSKKVVIVEGVFDAIKAGENAIPILGGWIDENYATFRRLVVEGSDVVLCLDPDAYEKSLKIAKSLSEYGNKVWISQHKEKDFGDMTKEETKYWIDNAKLYEQTDRMTYLIQSIKSGSMF